MMSAVALPSRSTSDRVHHEVGDFKRWVATALGMKKHSTTLLYPEIAEGLIECAVSISPRRRARSGRRH
jgi:hypothetical protein